MEAYVSAPGIKRTVFEVLAETNSTSELSNFTIENLESKDIYEAATRGDAVALEAFTVGIVLSYIYILKGSIFAPILLHIMNNVVAYVIMIFKYQDRTIEDFIGDLSIFSTIYIVSAVVVLLGAIHIGYIFVKANRVVANGGELIDVSRGKYKSEEDE